MEFATRKRISWTKNNYVYCIILLSSAFPLRFQSTAENPSRGVMEIYKDGSWQKLCTRSWDTNEETLTCKAISYSNNAGYGNDTGYTDGNNAPDTFHDNCTTLTECGSNIDGKTQLCTGNLLKIVISPLPFFTCRFWTILSFA